MGILDKLKSKFVEPRKRPRKKASSDPTADRRKKFRAYLSKQNDLASATGTTTKKKGRGQKTDFWQDDDGTYIFAPRYGSSPVIIIEGKPHIAAGKKVEDLQGVIADLIRATESGELDEALAAAAERKTKTTKAAKAA